ncbi:MAG: glycoside hydrolase family 5 protein [Planctomycetota bacterium]
MKFAPLLLVFATLAYGNESQPTSSAQRDAFYWNALAKRGVNLGNALDAPEEGRWGVRLEEEYFDLIAKAGFQSVRIPVRWSAHAESAAPYTIDRKFLARVDWAIEQALSRDLVAVMTLHHFNEMYVAPDENRQRFLALWRQLSEHYSDYAPTLYFEILNEPNRKLTNDLWNEYLDEAIRLVRKTNPTRALVVGPAKWNSISQLKNLTLPTGDKNIIVTFHYYEPFQFTHQGASWVGKESSTWLGTQWMATEQEQDEVTRRMDAAVQWAEENQVPLYMGEFGAYRKADMVSRQRWTDFVRAEAEKRNISWAYWEFCARPFGIYDPASRRWRPKLLSCLLPQASAD